MLAFISFAALAVDIGYILTTKNELQNIADAAALAAAGRLSEFYDIGETPIESSVELAANTVASMNSAGGEAGGITIVDSDIELGTWNGGFTETSINPYATRITARRDDIPTFFAKLFSNNPVDIQAMAIAAFSTPIDLGGMWYIAEPIPRLVK